jgi:hypothetical protein
MRYSLRTLLLVLALGPPVLTGAWWAWARWTEPTEVLLPSHTIIYEIME